MNNRRKFLAAGGALAALSALPKAKADPQRVNQVYVHGMVWNRQLAAPMNDWLLRVVAKADIPIGNAAPSAVPGFATIGDDFHDGAGSHVEIREATLKLLPLPPYRAALSIGFARMQCAVQAIHDIFAAGWQRAVDSGRGRENCASQYVCGLLPGAARTGHRRTPRGAGPQPPSPPSLMVLMTL